MKKGYCLTFNIISVGVSPGSNLFNYWTTCF